MKSTPAVPVAAVVATPDGRPAVAVGIGKFRHLVPISVGLFDAANALIQIHMSSVHADQPSGLPAGTSDP